MQQRLLNMQVKMVRNQLIQIYLAKLILLLIKKKQYKVNTKERSLLRKLTDELPRIERIMPFSSRKI